MRVWCSAARWAAGGHNLSDVHHSGSCELLQRTEDWGVLEEVLKGWLSSHKLTLNPESQNYQVRELCSLLLLRDWSQSHLLSSSGFSSFTDPVADSFASFLFLCLCFTPAYLLHWGAQPYLHSGNMAITEDFVLLPELFGLGCSMNLNFLKQFPGWF